MKAITEQVCRTCLLCQQTKKKGKDQRHTLYSSPVGAPFQSISVDWVGPLNESRVSGAKHLLTIRCNFSKWLEAIPCRDTRTTTFLQHLENFISRYGLPTHLKSDAAQCFRSAKFREFMAVYGITATTTSGYNPKVIQRNA